MKYSRFATGFRLHRKVRDRGDAAFRLWASAIDLAREERTEGLIREADFAVIPTFQKPSKRRAQAIQELTESGLWEAVPDGWLIHDYLEYQESAVIANARNERARVRMKVVRANTVRTVARTDREHPSEHDANGERTPSLASLPSSLSSSPDQNGEESEHFRLTSSSPKDLTGSARERADCRAVFDFWQLEHGHTKAIFDPKRESRIRSRLREGFTVERLCVAIRNAKNDPHLMGQTDRNTTVYDGLETLLRDAAQVERLEALTAPANGARSNPRAPQPNHGEDVWTPNEKANGITS